MKRWIHAKEGVTDIPKELSSRPYVFTLNSVNSTYNDDILEIAENNGAIKVKYQEVNPKTGNLFREGYWKFAVPSEKVAQSIFDDVKKAKIPTHQSDVQVVKTDWNDNYNIWIDDYADGTSKVLFNSKFKKPVESASNLGSNHWAKIRLAQDTLKKYTNEQVDYVRKCYDDVLRDISDYYTNESDDPDVAKINTNAIKTDWLIGAIEDDLMEEEDFEDIYTALETLGEEEAAAWA